LLALRARRKQPKPRFETKPRFCELLSNLVDGSIELGGGLFEWDSVLKDDSLEDLG
jgi:hypothetical protein